jgi:hypothetical protein
MAHPIANSNWGGDEPSPALTTLLADGRKPFTPREWKVSTPPASPVVVDFVPGKGMLQAKNYCGYFLRGVFGGSVPGEGMLALYNFGAAPLSGELALDGDAWTLGTGARRMTLMLQPGERREIPVLVRPGQRRFESNPVRATWRVVPGAMTEAAAAPPQTAEVSVSKADSRGVAAQAPVEASFDAYFRTKNGNLFGSWQRLKAKGDWQSYTERMGNFSMAFYCRANLPWRFRDNEPAALVFFFRPEKLPATYEVRQAEVLEFTAADAVGKGGKD